MPELPEVETVACQLRPLVSARVLRRLEIIDKKLAGAEGLGSNWTVRDLQRVGKQIVFFLERGTKRRFVAVHLRMTGRLIWRPAEGKSIEPGRFYHSPEANGDAKYLRARFLFEEGELHFLDVRRFGTITTTETLAELEPIGLDPLSQECTKDRVYELLHRSAQPLKAWLLRQDRLVGLGNIYACEILYAAGLNPFRASDTLDKSESAVLWRETRRILQAAIKNCGTTFSDFQDSRGELGGYQRYLKVYDRQGEPCSRCGAAILRVVQGGRSTFYCKECQGGPN